MSKHKDICNRCLFLVSTLEGPVCDCGIEWDDIEEATWTASCYKPNYEALEALLITLREALLTVRVGCPTSEHEATVRYGELWRNRVIDKALEASSASPLLERLRVAEEVSKNVEYSAVRCENCAHADADYTSPSFPCTLRGTFHQFTCDWWTSKDDTMYKFLKFIISSLREKLAKAESERDKAIQIIKDMYFNNTPESQYEELHNRALGLIREVN